MRLLRLFFPGSFEDAQLYMGHLVAFSTEREARVVEMQTLTTGLEERYPSWKGVLTLAFARNDWLNSGVLAALTSNPALAQAMNTAVDELVAAELTLDESDVSFEGLTGFQQEADVILDTVFYGTRLYLGSTSGFFDYSIDWQELRVEQARKRLDARCISATAEYGAVNASCEEDGLFTGFDELGWRGSADVSPALAQTAPRSLRTGWYGTDLVNYGGQADPELLHSSVEEVDVFTGPFESERKVVTSFGAPSNELEILFHELNAQRGVPKEDVQFVWNSSRAFFINTYDHGFFGAYPTTTKQSGYRFTRHGKTDGRVVDVHRFSRGWVVETDFRAYVLTGGKLVALLDREPLAVRTFEGSKRYRRLIAVTVEDGVHLISAIDDF